jgi:hypothetical protein
LPPRVKKFSSYFKFTDDILAGTREQHHDDYSNVQHMHIVYSGGEGILGFPPPPQEFHNNIKLCTV